MDVVRNTFSTNETKFDVSNVSNSISSSISKVIGTIGTIITAMISGVAVIMSGLIDLVLGAIIGVYAFFLGKEALEETISDFLVDKIYQV